MHVYFTNSDNNVFTFHDGEINSTEDAPCEADSNECAPKSPNYKTVIIQSLGIFYLMLIIESTILALLVLVFIPCLEKNFQFEGNVNLSMFIHFEIQSFIKVAGLENIIKNISLYATSLVWKLCQFA